MTRNNSNSLRIGKKINSQEKLQTDMRTDNKGYLNRIHMIREEINATSIRMHTRCPIEHFSKHRTQGSSLETTGANMPIKRRHLDIHQLNSEKNVFFYSNNFN